MNVGVILMLKSGLPGLAVEPIVKKLLTDNNFTETNINGTAVYRYTESLSDGVAIPILVRVEGSYIYAALSGQNQYAQTLITGVR